MKKEVFVFIHFSSARLGCFFLWKKTPKTVATIIAEAAITVRNSPIDAMSVLDVDVDVGVGVGLEVEVDVGVGV